MLERIGRIALPPWAPFAVIGVVVAFTTLLAVVISPPKLPTINVAFVGNSMIYYNDFPRFMEALSAGHLTQDSCLHGNADLTSILQTGNGMSVIWNSGTARLFSDDAKIHDFGACTVKQLLFGYDEDLENRIQGHENDDFYVSDGLNPCLTDQYYYKYLQSKISQDGAPAYDFIVLNDNTRSPARLETRTSSLTILANVYVPMFLESGAIPVFLCTYGYDTPYRDMGGLGTVAEFTSLTYEGYQEYVDFVASYLPEWQRPRIAPVGLAFLTVYEENYSFWQRLFHVDQIHASPLGTYLQGCVVYHTLFGVMPPNDVAVRPDMSLLWIQARRFQPGEHRRSPFPTQGEAAYLYDVAERVVQRGYVPKSFIHYKNGEAAEYTPQDDLYRIDDLY